MTENEPDYNVKRRFSLAQVLSITTGKAFTDWTGIGEILTFMLGQKIPMSLASKAAMDCRLEILNQHPQLDLQPVYAKGMHEAWLIQAENIHGEYMNIEQADVDIQNKFQENIESLEEVHKKTWLPG